VEKPFDIKDLVTIQYDRHHLMQSLGEKLTQSVSDTIADMVARTQEDESQDGMGDAAVAVIQDQLSELKDMMGQMLREWKRPVSEVDANGKTGAAQGAAKVFEGAWFNPETGSYLYAREVQGEILMPYCY
jgi:hypothetical protein